MYIMKKLFARLKRWYRYGGLDAPELDNGDSKPEDHMMYCIHSEDGDTILTTIRPRSTKPVDIKK